MTVKELIEKLQKFDSNMEVCIEFEEEHYGINFINKVQKYDDNYEIIEIK